MDLFEPGRRGRGSGSGLREGRGGPGEKKRQKASPDGQMRAKKGFRHGLRTKFDLAATDLRCPRAKPADTATVPQEARGIGTKKGEPRAGSPRLVSGC